MYWKSLYYYYIGVPFSCDKSGIPEGDVLPKIIETKIRTIPVI